MRQSTLSLGILAFLFVVTLSSCKLALVVIEGGEIQSESGSFGCLAGSNCVVEIENTSFREVFIAVPAPGFEFVKWVAGPSFQCGGSTDPRCVVDNHPLAGNAFAELIVASDTFFYILPEFKPTSTPPPDPQPSLTVAQQAQFDDSCSNCHTFGLGGAPKVGEILDWEPRLAKGIDTLVGSVKNGFGSMPAGGRCDDCSDDDYEAIILFMSSEG
ncbi:MAG: c-type cytochrome [Halioglobus sp.]